MIAAGTISIETSLRQMLQKGEQSKRAQEKLAVPALYQLLRSRFLKEEQWVDLKELAQNLRQLNWRAISLANKNPEIFDDEFIASRRAENAVYGDLIALLNERYFTWRKNSPVVYTRPLSYYDDVIFGRSTNQATKPSTIEEARQ